MFYPLRHLQIIAETKPLLQVLDGEVHFPDQGIEDTKRKVKEMHGCVVSCAEVVIDIIFCAFPSDIDLIFIVQCHQQCIFEFLLNLGKRDGKGKGSEG